MKMMDDDNRFVPVTTPEQALKHLKLMRAGIKNGIPYAKDDDEKNIAEVQVQALTIAIDILKEQIANNKKERNKK